MVATAPDRRVDGATGPRHQRWVLATAVALALVVLAPVLVPGYVLVGDMVFVPHRPFTAAVFGLDTQVPRAVPSDLLVAVASTVVPGQVVQKVVLAGILVGAAAGAGRLAPFGVGGRVASAVAYVWNPFVYERLLLGQWALLVGYAAAPWAVRAALALRSSQRRAWPRVVLTLSAAACGGAAASMLAVPVALAAAGRRAWVVVGAAAVVNAPWWVPSVLRPGGVPGDPDGADVFRARSDTPLGLLASLLTGGGAWNGDTVPPGRDSWALAVPLLALLVLGVAGVVLLARVRPDLVAPLAAVAAAGLLLAAVPGLVRPLVEYVPGGGLLRDSQRLVAPWVLLAALGLGALADRLASRAVIAAALVAAPVAVLPGLAWGLGGELDPVRYPADWTRTADAVAAAPPGTAVLVLPWQPYRRFGWNADRTVLDPAPRWFDRQVIASDDLPVAVAGRVTVVSGEDRLAARVSAVLASGAPLLPLLRDLGVSRVVVEREAGGAVDPALLAGTRLVRHGESIDVYAVPGAGTAPRTARPPWPPVVAADVAAAAVAAACVLLLLRGRRADRLANPPVTQHQDG